MGRCIRRRRATQEDSPAKKRRARRLRHRPCRLADSAGADHRFSFSMAVSRYDQRKNYEEAEANAIGTAYLRVDLLSTEDAAKVRQLLRVYVERRIDFYRGNKTTSASIGNDLKTVQDELWSTVVRAGAAQPNPVLALAVSGINDIF